MMGQWEGKCVYYDGVKSSGKLTRDSRAYPGEERRKPETATGSCAPVLERRDEPCVDERTWHHLGE